MNIYEKLQNARVALQELNLKKSGKNKFAGFEYYELSDFLPSVNKIFKDLKLFSNFSIINGIASLNITDAEDDNQEVTFTSPVETLDLKGCNKLQALGGVHTYMKRYLYQNALEIVENDMFDAQAGTEKAEDRDPDTDLLLGIEAAASSDEVQRFYTQYKNDAKDIEAFKTAYAKRWKMLKAKEKKEAGNVVPQ